MSELLKVTIEEESRLQYEHTSLNADARRQLYKYAVPSRDIWQEILDSIELTGNEGWLDVGTGRGHFLELLEHKINDPKIFPDGFKGSILGVDKFSNDFFAYWQRLHKEDPLSPISFAYADAENLHWPDHSADVISALFLLYHVNHPEKALEQFKRVLKPGGKLIVATRGTNNQERLWRLGSLVADRVGATRPLSFYERFNPVIAEQVLSWMFTIEKVEHQNSELHIPIHAADHDSEGWRDYRQALFSLKDIMFDQQTGLAPRGKLVKDQVDGDIAHLFHTEANSKGYFADRVEQSYFVCINDKL